MSLSTSIINRIAPLASAIMTLAISAGAVAASNGAVLPMLSVKPVATPAGLYIYSPNTTVKLNIHAGAPAAKLNVRWNANDFAGHRVAGGIASLDTNGSGTVTLSTKTSGIVYIYARLIDTNRKEVSSADTQVAFMTPSRSIKENKTAVPVLFGVCAHFHNSDAADRDRELSLISALGFRACRFDCVIDLVHPSPSVSSWEMYDHIFGCLSKSGVEPCPLLVDWSHNPGVIGSYAPFAAEAARRYRRMARYWEIWNEPDLGSWKGTAEQYAAFFDQASKAILKEEPDASIMNGGVSEVKMRPNFVPDFLQAARVKPAIFAYHSHGEFSNMARATTEIQRHISASGRSIPLWLNEAGYSNWGKLTEREQAIILTKKMAYIPALGAQAYFWYELRDDGVNKPDPESNYGLVDRDFLPKASSIAAHTLMGTLQGQRFIRRIPVARAPQVYALLFGDPASHKGTIALWNEAGNALPCMWRVPGKAMQRTIMDNEAALPSRGGVITATAASEPQFIVFKGAFDKVASAGLPHNVSIPRQRAMAVPRENHFLDAPTFMRSHSPLAALGQRNIVSLFEAAPVESMRFHGDTDLSARLYMSRASDGLHIIVAARDDTFSQSEHPGEEWKGDSLQWAIALPTGESYEWTAALTPQGPMAALDFGPPGAKAGPAHLSVHITRSGTVAIYDIVVPPVLPGGKPLADHFSFTCLVNDNDGRGRKGWIELTPGIGWSKDPLKFQPMAVRGQK